MRERNDETAYSFLFTPVPQEGYTSVIYDDKLGVPIFNTSVGFGFTNQTCSLPPRVVHTSSIISTGAGFVVSEPEFDEQPGGEPEHYNNYGMAFRIQAPAGAYEILVTTTSEAEDTMVSISGMHAGRLIDGGFWDAAGLVPVRMSAEAKGKEWFFCYVNGRDYIDVEVEPKRTGIPVGLNKIVVKPVRPNVPPERSPPTVYLLGDSTVKSYTFDEAPMSGWGQIIGCMFDGSKVNVINYSMGGRSFKNSYWEGRFNDILMTGHVGDYILIQFGHNDERQDENHRYGRGSTEVMYETYIREMYLPAILARGMIPLFVTPVSRIKGHAEKGHIYTNSFQTRRFPDILKRLGMELGVTVLDLNTESVKYYNRIGVDATTAVFMSIEAGETPGKTNDGSLANGHPAHKIDGTHYKEALSKQLARMVVTELVKAAAAGDMIAGKLASFLMEDVGKAVTSDDWSSILPEKACDTQSGEGAYYRNQIEKMIQLGVMEKDDSGSFNPASIMRVEEFILAIRRLMRLDEFVFRGYAGGVLTREVMGALLDDAYHTRFQEKPKYMTDYNGRTLRPGDGGYDPNLDSGGAQGITYYPVIPFERLSDIKELTPALAGKVKDAYSLGLIRSEKEIVRGRPVNGTELEPQASVTRAKAAKALYFMWVLSQPAKVENHIKKLEE
jgi:lysophospholipase L1-like esterase